MSYFKSLIPLLLFMTGLARADYSPIYTCPGPYACIFTSYLGLQFPDGTTQTTAAGGGSSYTFSLPLLNTAGTVSIPVASSTVNGYLSSANWSTFNNKQASGNYITALTSDVSASGPGSAASTVNSVGGSSAANIHTAELAANAATSTNTFSTIVERDGTGSFLAGSPTFTGLSLTGFSGVLKTTAGSVSGSATTTDLTEGSNLYFTSARALTAAAANLTGKEFYVAQDTGNDSNAGGLLTPFRTIQAGVNACNAVAAYYAQCDVHVAPSQGGTGSGYLETVTFSQQGVNLICDAPSRQTRACLISGQIIINLTGLTGGVNFNATTNQVSMTGFVVSATSTTNAVLFSGTPFQQFISDNNYFDQNGSVSSVVVSNSGTSGGTGSTLYSYDTVYSNSNATNPTVTLSSGARFWMYGTNSVVANGNASGPSVTQSGAGSSAIFNLVQITGQYNLTDNTSTATFNLSTIASGTNPCIVTPSSPNTGYALLAYYGCNSTNTNSITGTGVVVNSPGNIRLNTSGDIISTVTQSSFPGLPQGEVMIGSGATTGTNVALSIKDGHIKVAQTTAPTTTLSGNAGTGGTPACTITNGTDSDGKISLKTGTSAWATGTQCTINFNKAWGVAPICIFSPSNDAASTAMASQRIVFPDAATTTQTISAGVAFASQVTATFHYHCGESQ